jgi:hypothetical protein
VNIKRGLQRIIDFQNDPRLWSTGRKKERKRSSDAAITDGILTCPA